MVHSRFCFSGRMFHYTRYNLNGYIFDIFIEFIEFEEFEDKNHLSNNNIIINKFITVCEKLYSKYKNSKNKNLYNNVELLNNEYYKYNTNNKETIVNDYFEYIIQKM